MIRDDRIGLDLIAVISDTISLYPFSYSRVSSFNILYYILILIAEWIQTLCWVLLGPISVFAVSILIEDSLGVSFVPHHLANSLHIQRLTLI